MVIAVSGRLKSKTQPVTFDALGERRRNISGTPKLRAEIRKHYERGFEQYRLLVSTNQLEYYRMKELISRHLTKNRAVVLDIGGGPGAYACWLARRGHIVHLVDPIPLHLEQAQRASQAQPRSPLASASRGEARHLEFEDRSADALLLMGPLYHLVDRRHRQQCLSEASRTLKRGGLLFASAMSRFYPSLLGFFRNGIRDKEFFEIIQRNLRDGQHRNTTRHGQYFTTAFLHHPEELKNEIQAVGFKLEALYAVEGPGWLAPNFEKLWAKRVLRERLLTLLRAIESEPTLLGHSVHFLVVARKRT
ncbi:MAG: SAM-dependent methyltransferase [Acidobacteria bacterium]|nr:MAG: SAM-dependent methyltransferase [Acidobacteriota bacterium]